MIIRFRQAKREDIPDMRGIYEYYVRNTSNSFECEVPSAEEFSGRLQRITAHFPWLVCEVDGSVVGYSYAEKVFQRAAYQWDADTAVYVRADFQRRGIAREFYRCIEYFLKQQGFYNLYAIVAAVNEQSKSFHEAMGYSETAYFHKAGFKLGAWQDVAWYAKRLQEEDQVPEQTIPFYKLPKELVTQQLEASEGRIGRRFEA